MHDRRTALRRQGERLSVWIATGAILYAPLAYGATTPLTKSILDGWLAMVALVLLLHGSWRHPLRMPHSLLAAVGIVWLAGACFLLNPKFRHEPRLDFLEPIPGAVPWLPGTYDFSRSLPEVLHFAALSLFLLALARLCAHPEGRWFLLRAIALAGFVVATAGIYQKASGASTMLWSDRTYAPTFFAAFRYHGNAAAFLNLCWPASLALVLRSLERKRRRPLETSVWASCLFFTFGALFVNTSKFGHLAAIPAALFGLVLFRRHLPRLEGQSRVQAWLLGIFALAALAVLSLFSAEMVSGRWAEALERGGSVSGRLSAYRAALAMLLRESGLLGLGPGCFGIVFPYYMVFGGAELGGSWTHAHQDLLQVLVEWGIPGGGAILFICGGAGWRILRKRRQQDLRSLSLAAALLALVVVAAHSLVDFPLHIGAIQVVAAVYLAIGWAPERPQASGEEGAGSRRSGKGRRRVRVPRGA